VPWRCPACGTQIHHGEAEAAPRPGARYRCHICRLELVLDPASNKLTVPTFDVDSDPPPPSNDKTKRR
jgi:hypothetical protein